MGSCDWSVVVPGAAGGIDMDSDLIIDIAKGSSNICGVKLT
jgi:4-hydroxy-2-oxoglutarate aldolase